MVLHLHLEHVQLITVYVSTDSTTSSTYHEIYITNASCRFTPSYIVNYTVIHKLYHGKVII